MGEVYRATDTRLQRTVAIKWLHAEFAERADRRARFEAEARAVSSLSHPHICALFDVGEHDGRAFLVMEYLEGETLDDRLTRGPVPVTEVLRYGAQIADALDHAHRRHVIHRDVKPSNVMVTASGVKLLDFGLAKGPPLVAAVQSSTLSFHEQKLTAEGSLIGTFRYMAPEQLEGKPVDERTDVFALGTVLYEMATGRRAFDSDNQASLIASILTREPPALSSACHTTDSDSLAALEHVVERCLAKNPEERWQTARDVRLELQWQGEGRPAPRAARPAGRTLRPREVLAWVLALIAGAWAAIEAWHHSTRRSGSPHDSSSHRLREPPSRWPKAGLESPSPPTAGGWRWSPRPKAGNRSGSARSIRWLPNRCVAPRARYHHSGRRTAASWVFSRRVKGC